MNILITSNTSINSPQTHLWRTDLIRFGKFGETWWDKESSASTREVFPYPSRVLSTNPTLVQNSGY